MKKIIFALFLWFVNSVAEAHLYVNDGPLFKVAETGGKITQDRAIQEYLIFSSKTAQVNRTRLAELSKVASALRSNPNAVLPFAPDKQDGFDFHYSEAYAEWPALKIQYGLCQGFTSGLRNFHYFSFFRPELKAPFGPEQPVERLKYYKTLVNNIFLGNVTIVPEFKDLSEFSKSSPEIVEYLKVHLANAWAIYNVVEGGSDYLNIGKIPDLQSLGHLQANIEALLKRNFQPRLLYRWGEWKDIHVVRAVKVTPVVNGCFSVDVIETDGYLATGEEICIGSRTMIAKNEWEHFADAYISYLNFCLQYPNWCR